MKETRAAGALWFSIQHQTGQRWFL